MAGDYIPSPDSDFKTWQANFITYANAHLAGLGIVAADMAPLTLAQTTWNGAYSAHTAAQAAAQSASQNKDAARVSFEALVRALVARLQASPAVDDGERAALGITVRDATKTPVVIPTTRPIARVDTSQRLRHVIEFSDEATPTKKAKPAGVMGAEIWVKCGDPAPTDPSQCGFLALDTRTPTRPTIPARTRARSRITCCAGSTRAARMARGARRLARRLGREECGIKRFKKVDSRMFTGRQ